MNRTSLPRAFTLVELLVITVIFASLMGLLVLGGRSNNGSQIRLLSQSIASAILSTQSNALGNEAGSGLILTPATDTPVASNTLYNADVPPYAKGSVSSGMPPANLATTSTVVSLAPTNTAAADLVNGYKILFRCDSPSYVAPTPWMSITNGTQVAFRTSANQTNQNTLWPKPPAGATLNFAMARYPIKSSLAVDVTKTAAIDLRYSGVGNTLTGDYGALANKGAIAICFNSIGALDAVMQNVLSTTKTVQPIQPAAPLYLLIASLSDIQANRSLQQDSSRWLAIAHNSGRVTIASNVPQAGTTETDVVNARKNARLGIATK